MPIDLEEASFKDFENIEGKNIYATAQEFEKCLNFLKVNDHLNYRIVTLSHCGRSEMDKV